MSARRKICYYKILGISEKAGQDDVKRAFRMLALRWHPDRNPLDPDASERFREALKAYETLVDPVLRGRYDRANGHAEKRRRSVRRRESEGEGDGSSLGEALKEFFGIDYAQVKERRGSDLRFDLQMPRALNTEGRYESIDYRRWVFCPDCLGNGRKRPLRSCVRCGGVGEIEEVCSVRVWVPPNCEEGTRLRVCGAGDRLSPGGGAGDLYVLLHII